MLGEDSGAVPVTAYPEACLGSGNMNRPCLVPAPSSMVAAPTGAPALVQDYVGTIPVAAYPDLSHGSGDTPSSPARLPPCATPAPASGLILEGYANNGAVSVSTYLEACHGSGDTSLSAPEPSLALAAPAPGRMLEEYSGVVSFDLYNKVFHGSGHQSTSAPAPSSAVAVPAPALAPMLNGAVPFTAYPEVFHDNRNKSSSIRAPSSVVAVPAPALVPMLNGAVPFTAYPEVFHDNMNKSSWVQAPSSVVAVSSQVPAPGGMIEENNVMVSVTAYPHVGHDTGNNKSSSPSSMVAPALASGRTLEDYVKEWAARKAASGAPLHHCVLPFLTGAPKAVECRLCYKLIHPLEEIKCSVSRCEQAFHLSCVVEDTASFTAESFKCPQHGCMVCKQKMFFWRCGRCTVAAHTKCAPWPLIHLKNDQGSAICWRHPSNWLLQNENADLTNNIEEAFCRLPLPYVNEEFNIDSTIRDFSAIVCKPPSYTHIRRNVYLVKKKRADSSAETGCRNCRADSVCSDDCECRGLSMSCSKNCRCSDLCSNKPFRKDKKFKIVKSEGCGWGAVALEPLEKGDFIIEYVGEVINDATCEQRLWEMKRRGDKNFYMCEISKDCTIDATFKGNTSRFLNHSCDPNCKLEKWQVEGETRVGVFASCSIQVGEPLTYDYRFVHFGEKVKCNCGAKSCQGYLGIQLKNPTQGAQTAAAALENEGDCSPSRLKPETHLLPWTNCIEVPFNLRSKTKIDRLCWGRKRQRTSIIDPSPSSASGQLSVIEAAASVPKGFSAELA
uniref:Uncharacterized protein n=1 Tax=Avena sativa TaxID=4498 RepID=A0ACD5YCN0_AVESA